MADYVVFAHDVAAPTTLGAPLRSGILSACSVLAILTYEHEWP
jgi:hypothetical protein